MTMELVRGTQPLLLLGERRRRALEQRISLAAGRWADAWAVAAGPISVSVESRRPGASPDGGPRSFCGVSVCKASGEWLASVLSLRPVAAWAATGMTAELMTPSETRGRSMAADLELHLLGAFWDSLTAGTIAAEASLTPLEAQSFEAANADLGRRSIRVTLAFGSGSPQLIELRLSPAIVSQVLAEPRARYPGGPLSSRRAAISGATVTLECQVGAVQLTVRELHSMRTGDVLVTDTLLDGRVELRIPGKAQPIALGTIADRRGKRSLVVEELRRGLNR